MLRRDPEDGAGAREHFGDVDGLRVLALAAVVVYEVVRLAPPLPLSNQVLALAVAESSQGLTLFLLLSGFGLAYPLLAQLERSGWASLDIGAYLVKRALRIYPAYLATLALMVAVPVVGVHFGFPAAATSGPPIDALGLLRYLVFAGDGLANDGFRALAVVAHWYLIFPFALALWVRNRRLFASAVLIAGIANFIPAIHAVNAGALVPLLLGIVAAQIRVQPHPFERFGFGVAFVAAVIALALEPSLTRWTAPPEVALRIDPFWSVALFGVLAGAGSLPEVGRFLSRAPVRVLAGTAFSTSLVLVPVVTFVLERTAFNSDALTAALEAAAAAVCAGFILYLLVDRWFAPEARRLPAAERYGPMLDRVLARASAAQLTLGTAPEPAPAESSQTEPVPVSAPDPASLAVVSLRTGSPEDLEAEILAAKRRLAEHLPVFESDGTPALPSHAGSEPAIDAGPVEPPASALTAGEPDLETPPHAAEPAAAEALPESPKIETLEEPPAPAEPAMPSAAAASLEAESTVTNEAGALMDTASAAEAVQIEERRATDEPVAARSTNGKPIRIRIGPLRSGAADHVPGTISQTDVTHG